MLNRKVADQIRIEQNYDKSQEQRKKIYFYFIKFSLFSSR